MKAIPEIIVFGKRGTNIKRTNWQCKQMVFVYLSLTWWDIFCWELALANQEPISVKESPVSTGDLCFFIFPFDKPLPFVIFVNWNVNDTVWTCWPGEVRMFDLFPEARIKFNISSSLKNWPKCMKKKTAKFWYFTCLLKNTPNEIYIIEILKDRSDPVG